MNENNLRKFQDLLRTLFQFDCADLDFGIYRTLNYKRTQVAIAWRSVVGLEDNEEALMQDKACIEQTVLPALVGDAEPDRLLVNGACFVKDAEAIEPEFKRLMFAPVGA